MSAVEASAFLDSITFVVVVLGMCGGALTIAVYWVIEMGLDWLDRRADKQARIRDARWRARWQGFLSEAKQQGLQGREAILWAANAMRTHRQALRLLAGDGHG
jgi:hypothetical protein